MISGPGVLSKVFSIRTISSVHLHVTFTTTKEACILCVHMYLFDAYQTSQKGISFMSIANDGDLPLSLNILRTYMYLTGSQNDSNVLTFSLA